MFRVLLTEALEAAAEARLALRADIIRPPDLSEATLAALVADCDAMVVRSGTRVTATILAAGRRLRVVGVAAVGTDKVDLAAAAARGIAVVNTPAASTDAVADLAVTLMLLLLRPVPRLVEAYRQGRFDAARAAPHGRELRELTVGIVGMGRIGSAVGRRCAAGFGARVLYNDIVPVGPFDFPATPVEKPELWAASDIITLHVPLTELTRGLVDAAVLATTRPGALLINTARGAVVDTAALVAALAADGRGRGAEARLGGAGLDVTEPEPLPPDHPLFACTRCILTPHIAARTIGGWQRMCAVVDDVLARLAHHR